MITHERGGCRLALNRFVLHGFALVAGLWVLAGPGAMAQDGGPMVANQVRVNPAASPGASLHHGPTSFGTLGYGPPGVYPGFQGFGLGYHLGYGYGGDALGPGAEGGYPFYGGPGYPHCEPRLRRVGGITPFPYFGGPGYPTPEHPNFFGTTGPLVPDQPVVTIVGDRGDPGDHSTDYGAFTGAVPDAEVRFAPYTARAAAGTATMRARPVDSMPVPPTISPEARPSSPRSEVERPDRTR